MKSPSNTPRRSPRKSPFGPHPFAHPYAIGALVAGLGLAAIAVVVESEISKNNPPVTIKSSLYNHPECTSVVTVSKQIFGCECKTSFEGKCPENVKKAAQSIDCPCE